MIHKIGLLLALAASIISLATDAEKKGNKENPISSLSITRSHK